MIPDPLPPKVICSCLAPEGKQIVSNLLVQLKAHRQEDSHIMLAWTHTHIHMHGTHTHTHTHTSSVRTAVIDWWNGPLTLVVIFFALCLLLLTWNIAGITCRACHSSGTFFHCDTHTHTHTHVCAQTPFSTHAQIQEYMHAARTHTHMHHCRAALLTCVATSSCCWMFAIISALTADNCRLASGTSPPWAWVSRTRRSSVCSLATEKWSRITTDSRLIEAIPMPWHSFESSLQHYQLFYFLHPVFSLLPNSQIRP